MRDLLENSRKHTVISLTFTPNKVIRVIDQGEQLLIGNAPAEQYCIPVLFIQLDFNYNIFDYSEQVASYLMTTNIINIKTWYGICLKNFRVILIALQDLIII